MGLNISKQYQYVYYLGPDINISNLSSLSNIDSIVGISNNGTEFISNSYYTIYIR